MKQDIHKTKSFLIKFAYFLQIYTRTGLRVKTILSDECVDEIFEDNKRYFRQGLFGEGLYKLLDEYR